MIFTVIMCLVWYAGAYTVQTNTVPVNTGRAVPFMPPGGKCYC